MRKGADMNFTADKEGTRHPTARVDRYNLKIDRTTIAVKWGVIGFVVGAIWLPVAKLLYHYLAYCWTVSVPCVATIMAVTYVIWHEMDRRGL